MVLSKLLNGNFAGVVFKLQQRINNIENINGVKFVQNAYW